MKKLFFPTILCLILAACAPHAPHRAPSLTEDISARATQAAPATPALPTPSVLTEPQPKMPTYSSPAYKVIPLPTAMRGAWVATVENIDWPSKPGLPNKEQQEELTSIFDSLQKLHFNTVILQVRPAADTFWPSQKEPWSYYLTGKQGLPPAPIYDPLAFAVEQAHKRGLAIHAWFNPFRVQNSKKAALAKNHPANKYPQWVISYDDKLYYNPGEPAARQHAIDVILETVQRYNIDAVHLDDYFYPYPVKKNGKNLLFPDQASYQKYGQGLPLEDWRRNNVNAFVKDLSAAIKKQKKDLPLGISPFGVWRNQSQDKTGSATRAFSAYDDGLYADSRIWITQGWIDYVVPQLYWPFEHKTAPYGVLLKWWAEEIKRNPRVKLYIGLGTYKHGEEFKDKNELKNQISAARKTPGVAGEVHFNATRITKNQGNVQLLLKKLK